MELHTFGAEILADGGAQNSEAIRGARERRPAGPLELELVRAIRI